MSGVSAVWVDPTAALGAGGLDVATGDVLPATFFDGIASDLYYLYSILAGDNLQNITINTGKTFKYGAQRVLCSGTDARRHVCGNRLQFNSSTPATVSDTFATAFNANPYVVATEEYNAATQNSVTISAISTTACTVLVNNAEATRYVHYIALGGTT